MSCGHDFHGLCGLDNSGVRASLDPCNRGPANVVTFDGTRTP